MKATLLHYYNEDTDSDYVVIKPQDDVEDYKEDGYELMNECPLEYANVTLPLGRVLKAES